MSGELPFMTMDDIGLENKTVLLRLDINSPIDPTTGKILDDTRMRGHLPTLMELSESRVVILAHQSRPGKHDFVPLAEHARHMSSILGRKVKYIDELFGSRAISAIKNMKKGDVLMLENTRFYSEEVGLTKKSPSELANSHIIKKLSAVADIYINDAFAAAHRSQPSLVAFPYVMPSIAGRLLEREFKNLTRFIDSTVKPAVAVLGGAKVDDSIDVIENFLKHKIVDHILTTGVVATLFLLAAGYDVGKENKEFLYREVKDCKKYVEKAKSLLQGYGEKIILPTDLIMNVNGYRKAILVSDFPPPNRIYDIGLDTIVHYANIIENARKVILNGPAGVFELPNFALGTVELFNAVARCKGFTVAGGGHTVALIRQLGLESSVDHISTGGGALISFLAGKPMPVIDALKHSKEIYSSGGY